ncbi:MAG: exodeoxyribonuclease V subunit beta [Verrucomicrobia bacterium]|nr:exodeoxyribonuclease V subunit beta [Verrucomicrobiota bacterium]
MNFDLGNTPLERGTTLIEASAGTGKTFTIAGIYLRLIVEEQFTVENILVVTFTEAATAELRDRVRKVLTTAAADFSVGESETPYIQALIERNTGNRLQVLPRLERAIRDFDQSAIFTIHGFCQRALKEHAFESGILFDTELITDQAQLVQETIQDFWRKHFYTDSSPLVHFALRYKSSPGAFVSLTKSCLNHGTPKILTGAAYLDSAQAGHAVIELFQKMKRLWCLEKPVISQLFADLSWAKLPLNKSGVAQKHLEAITECLESDKVTAETLEWIGGLCSSALAKSTRAKKSAPAHEFFKLCEEMKQLERDYISGLEVDCIEFVQTELARRKRKQNVQFFQDLLSNLHNALQTRGGTRLANSLREKYKAALIDEFQDTDPLQYQIFSKVFATGEENFLFLIGDPKQAIYAFRGADIFTYLKAAAAAERRYSLPDNFRSESPLVHAVNTLFQSGKDPFIFPGIQFAPVTAQGKADEEPLTINGKKEAPLQLWIWDDPNIPATKTNAESLLPRIVAAEISRLLAADAKLGECKLRPSDFAVLVLENQQARLMQQALREFSIPSVLHTNESLFATHEAIETKRLLASIAEPSNERLLRAALATDMMALDAGQIDALAADEQGWQNRLEQFRDYHQLWVENGFIQMFRHFLLAEHVRQRLLSYQDGERRLTNLLHLSEVLHGASLERQLGPRGLLKWLNDQIGAEGEPAEENQLRLESDDNAVQLVTVHKSKGLEYPIVFCPFSWKPAKIHLSDKNLAWFHAEDELALDLGSAELAIHQDMQVRENLAEKMRLLYVAITRARNRCYVVWGKFRESENSALAYLLHQPITPEADLWKATAARFADIGEDDFTGDLASLATRSQLSSEGETIRIGGLPADEGTPYTATEKIETPHVRTFTGWIEGNWRITSFSALKNGVFLEMPDFDAEESVEKLPAVERVATFPTGIRSGLCIHQIFQALDFTDPSKVEGVVREKLKQHGFSEEHNEVVGGMVKNVLTAQLRGIGQLTAVPHRDRLDELEFYFPLNEISPAAIDNLFRKHDVVGLQSNPPPQIGRLTFIPVQGFMKGFVDTVIRSEGRFYIVDWKSNLLGSTPEDYSREAMRNALLNQYYHLQYHIYSLALHRYLQRRLPGYDYEKNFGGVYYIFLRGLDPGRPELGVFHDCPTESLISDFDQLLIPSGTP